MAGVHLEQLYYTWTRFGLERAPGLQARAGSVGLLDMRGKRYASLKPHLGYEAPHGALTDPAIAPTSLALMNMGEERALLHKAYIGPDGHGRPGNYFVHALVGPPETLTLAFAVQTWRSPFWRRADTSLRPGEAQLPVVDAAEVVGASAPVASLGDASLSSDTLAYAIAAALSLEPGQQFVVAASPDEIVAILRGLTRALPTPMQQRLTFSTYERDVSRSPASVVGAVVATAPGRSASAADLPERCYWRGPALNCRSGRRAPIARSGELAPYANFAAGQLTMPDRDELVTFLALANGARIASAGQLVRAFAFARGEPPANAKQFDALLDDPPLLAVLLSRPAIRALLLDAITGVSGRAMPALDALEQIVGGAETTALAALADEASLRAVRHLAANDLRTAKVMLETLPRATGATDDGPRCAVLLRRLAEIDAREPATAPTRELRWFMLALAGRAEPQPPSADVRAWFPSDWDELADFLADPDMAPWQKAAVQWLVGPGGVLAGELPRAQARIVAERLDLFAAALGDMLRQPVSSGPARSPTMTYHGYVREFVVGLGRAGAPGHLELAGRLLDSGAGAAPELGDIVRSAVHNERAFLDFVEGHASSLFGNPIIRPAALALVPAYLEQVTATRAQRSETRVTLDRIKSTLLITRFEHQSLLLGWVTIANFLAKPDCSEARLKQVAKAFDDVILAKRSSSARRNASEIQGELASALTAVLAALPPSRAHLTSILNHLSKPLAGDAGALVAKLLDALPSEGAEARAERLRAYLIVTAERYPPCNADEAFCRTIQRTDDTSFRTIDLALRQHGDKALTKEARKRWDAYVARARPPSRWFRTIWASRDGG